ncbi:phenylacetate-CoA oxygenase subunit PaaI [Kocuria rhizophila]|nr:phenylacetate-CoA oxygenase subunit PaaI [Kocuria rhizophila]
MSAFASTTPPPSSPRASPSPPRTLRRPAAGCRGRGPVRAAARRRRPDALQRLGWWTVAAPELEDSALGNIALDLIGHARFLLTYAGSASGEGPRSGLACFRDEEEFPLRAPRGAGRAGLSGKPSRVSYCLLLPVRALLRAAVLADQTLAASRGQGPQGGGVHQDHAAGDGSCAWASAPRSPSGASGRALLHVALPGQSCSQTSRCTTSWRAWPCAPPTLRERSWTA